MIDIQLLSMDSLIESSYEPERVFGYCRSCPNYMRNFSCPEHDFSTELYLDRYSSVLLVKHSLDLPQGFLPAEYFLSARRRIDPLLMKFEKRFHGEALLPGCCHNCHDDCSKLDLPECPNPGLRRYSPESLGMDINQMLLSFFGAPLEFLEDRITLVYGFLLTETPESSTVNKLESEIKSIDC